MIIKIKVYNNAQFTKSGRFKENAHTEFARMMVDIEPHTEGATDLFLKETAASLKKEYTDFQSPYIFTHLNARSRATGELVRIFEDVTVNGHDLITSPVKLREYLTS